MNLISLFIAFLTVSCARYGIYNHDEPKKIYSVISTKNLTALKKLFSEIPEKKEDLSASDQDLLNDTLTLTAAYGAKCDKEIVHYLRNKGAYLTYQSMHDINFTYINEEDSPRIYKIPLCGNYIIVDTLERIPRAESRVDKLSAYEASYLQNQSRNSRKVSISESHIVKGYSYFMEYLDSIKKQMEQNQKPQELQAALLGYEKILELGIKLAKVECNYAPLSASCINYGYYKTLFSRLKTKGYLDKNSPNFKYFKSFKKFINSKIKS